jgi:WD40 repeat protein
VFGEVVAVSAGEDGVLGLTSLAEADLGADRRRESEPDLPLGLDFTRPLRALAVTFLDNLPLVVVGDEDGRVHVVDLPEAAVSHSTQDVRGPAVTAVCLAEADGPVVVVGRADGTMQARTLPALEPVGDPVRTDGTEVFAIVPVSGSEVVAATGSGLLWRWTPGSAAPSRCYDGTPRVTALASAVLQPPDLYLLTGHDDGTVRVWDEGTAVIGQAELPARYAVAVAGTILDGHPLVLCGAENDEIYVLDVTNEKVRLTALTGHHDAVWDLTIIDLGERPGLLGAGEDGGVHLWLLDSLASVGSDDTFSGRRWSYGCLEESATGLIALAVDYGGRFALLDALSGEPRGDSIVPPDSASVSSSAVWVASQQIYWAVGTEAGQVGVGVWPGLAWLESPHQDWVTAAHFVELDGMLTLLTVSADGQVCFWDPDGARSDPRLQYRLSGLTDAVHAISVADSETGDAELLVGCRDGWAGSWRLRDGTLVEAPRQRTAERIDSIARLGQAIVTGDGAGQIVVPIPGTREATIQRHTRSVTRLIVTAGTDRAWLVTGGEDGIVTVAAEGRLDHPDVVLDVDAPVTDLLMLRNGLLAIATQYGVAAVKVSVAGWPGPQAGP